MKFFISLLLIGFSSLLSATTIQYYVSTIGNDITGNGSIENPWLSLHKAMNTVPFEQDNVAINLRDGVYVLPTVVYISEQRGGSEVGTFTIKSYNGENAVLDGSLIADFSAMVSINNAHYVTIENLEFTNLTGNKSGIYVSGSSSNITLYKNEIHGMQWTKDILAAKTPTPSDNLSPVVILGNNPEPMTNISIIDNTIYDLTTGYSEAVKIVGNVDGFLVEGNEIYDVTNICIVAAGNYSWVGLADASLNHARNGIIRYNETYRCVSPIAASAGIYADGAHNLFITENFSHHNTVGFSVGSEQVGNAKGIILSRNDSAKNTQAGIVIGTNTQGAIVEGIMITENEIRGNYTDAIYGGAPIIINSAKNITIDGNTISSISQYMITANQAVSNLNLNSNRYKSKTVNAENAVFVWAGITGENYFSFDTYRSITGQDSLSTFKTIGVTKN